MLIVISTGILSIGKYHENWIRYRSCSEKLISHKFRYVTKAPPYNTDQADDLFVVNIELLLNEENVNWAQVMSEIETPKTREDAEVEED